MVAWQWEEEVEDARIKLEDMDSLPTIGRMPKPKSKVNSKAKQEAESREKLKEWQQSHRDHLPTAPMQTMLEKDKVVNWLPYDSIEVVFNRDKLYANLQNHHPACISYDFEDEPVEEEAAKDKKDRDRDKKPPPKKWKTLLDKTANLRDAKG